MLTLGSLFDGIGGWQLAAVHAGVKPIWSSEIEKFPLAVTRKRFPDTKQLGDVTKITDVEPVDIVCAGSPCQDLSIAGKREGLAGERSGLFINAINIVRQMRMSTRGRQPRFFIWENVPGAFTSGSERGADFRAVLESIAETDIPMPKDGRWAAAGMVQCPKCEIAWRVLDAQYWGVPQRRKRIFLVADFAAADRRAAEVLFVEPCVPRDSAESERAREEIAGGTGKSIGSAGETLTPWDVQSNRIQSVNGKAAALYGGAGQGTHNGAVFDTRQIVMSVHENQQGEVWETNKFAALSTGGGKPGQGYPCVACYDMTHAQDVIRENKQAPTLNARMGTGGNQVPILMENIPKSVIMGHDERSARFHTETTDPLTACDYKQPPIVAQVSTGGGVQMAVDVRNSKEADINVALQSSASKNVQSNNVVRQQYAVRRLMPLECERLQGLPDGWTLINDKSCSDSARYKAIGNGMAQPCADYVIQRIVDEVGKT